MNGGSTEKAVERCRDEILDRIGMQGIDDFDQAYVVSEEVISEYVRSLLASNIDEIEKLVRKKLKNQGAK